MARYQSYRHKTRVTCIQLELCTHNSPLHAYNSSYMHLTQDIIPVIQKCELFITFHFSHRYIGFASKKNLQFTDKTLLDQIVETNCLFHENIFHDYIFDFTHTNLEALDQISSEFIDTSFLGQIAHMNCSVSVFHDCDIFLFYTFHISNP